MPINLEPFDYTKHKPQDVGLGGPSTEYLITVDSPEGGVMVIPSIWWDEEGKPILIKDQREAVSLAKDYEETTNKQFPRFAAKAYKEADSWAAKRSKAGGASKAFLARDIKEEQAKTAKTFKEAL
tara:strand:+ start:235 stop:609 length:375 start_codon:yes stop_codon:yes gene_type:complete